MLADLALITRSVPNPHRAKIDKARAVTIEAGENLSYKTRLVKVKAGEPLALTFSNPDVVPHNWALVRPGALDRVGEQANLLIADPDAVYAHYIPKTADVLAYSDIVLPLEKFTIYFRAPAEPGRYPYLCTFPGHWKVMNGELVVEK
jgi:azurin